MLTKKRSRNAAFQVLTHVPAAPLTLKMEIDHKINIIFSWQLFEVANLHNKT
jgi:hypothetical protein